MNRKSHPPRLIGFYRKYLLQSCSADFVNRVSQHYDLATLQRLAVGGGRTVRRAAVLALGMLGDMRVNDVLGRALGDRDRGVRLLADQWLREVWLRDGNAAQGLKLRIARRLNHSFQFDEALDLTTKLLDEAPHLAEAYHQRAIAFACLDDFEDAIADCRCALELNPFHFAAAAAMGQAMLETDDTFGALQNFSCALELNPSLDGVRARVTQLQRQLDQR